MYLRLADRNRWGEHFDSGISHSVAHVGVAANSKQLHQDTAIEGNGISVKLFFDVFGVHSRLIDTLWVTKIDDTAVGDHRHDGDNGYERRLVKMDGGIYSTLLHGSKYLNGRMPPKNAMVFGTCISSCPTRVLPTGHVVNTGLPDVQSCECCCKRYILP